MKFTMGDYSNGSSLQGFVNIEYATLTKIFGQPTDDGDGYKIDAMWRMKFADGTTASIYNYKDGKNYTNGKGMPISLITNWHIGGENKNAVDRVMEVIDEHTTEAA